MFTRSLIVLFFALISTGVWGQSSDIEPVPILDHNYKLTIHSLLEISAYEAAIDKVTKSKRADRMYRSLLEDLDSLSADSEPDDETLFNAIRQSAAIAHFYSIENDSKKAAERISQVRNWLMKFSEQFARSSKNKEQVLVARYLGLIGEFGASAGKGSAVPKLMELKKELSNNKKLSANIDLLVGYSLILSTSTMAQGKAYLKRAPSSSVYGRIAHRLTRVLMESGVDGEGSVYAGMSSNFSKDLKYTLNITKGAPVGVQNLVLDTAFFIWKARDPDLKEQLFEISSFKGLLPTDSYIERQALKGLAGGNFNEAIKRYESIVGYYRGNKFGYRIEKRIWKLNLKIYEDSKDIKGLQAGFDKQWKRNSRKNSEAGPFAS